MSKNIVFVSGANRGIGLEFVRQLSERGDMVFAGYRTEASSRELLGLAKKRSNISPVIVEVTDRYDVENLKKIVEEKFGRLDLVINNAGVSLKYSSPHDEVEPEDIMENFRVNVIGPFLAGKILRPLLVKGRNPKLINISSQMGSISRTSRSSGDATPYRISKAALNMLSKNQALSYEKDNIVTMALHPGWVKTDMGGPDAPMAPSESVGRMLKVIDQLNPAQNGSFLSNTGEKLDY